MAVEINPQFQDEKEGRALGRIERETLEAGGNWLAHNPSGFVRVA